jgi:hypothetical protein
MSFNTLRGQVAYLLNMKAGGTLVTIMLLKGLQLELEYRVCFLGKMASVLDNIEVNFLSFTNNLALIFLVVANTAYECKFLNF